MRTKVEYLRSYIYGFTAAFNFYLSPLCVSYKTEIYPIPVSEVSYTSYYNSLSLPGSESNLLTFITKLEY